MSPPRRALLVIDVQNEYVDGNLPIEFPPVAESLANVDRAMAAAAQAGIPIVIVQNTAPKGAPIFAPGTRGWELHATVTRHPRAHYVEKTLPSAFAGTDLGAWVRDNRIDTLTVVGYMTHNCVDVTIRQAVHDGLAAECLHDAIGALPYRNRAGAASAEEIHRAFTVVMQSRFAAVLSTAEWIALLASGAAPERDSVFKSNQRGRGLA